MILGFIWYHPKTFGSAWMNSLGLTEDDLKGGNMGMIFGLAFVMALLISYALSGYASHTEEGMNQFVHGMYHGFRPAMFFAVPVLVSNSLFQRNNLTNIIINALYWLITITLMGGVIYAWIGSMAAPAAGG